jgi:hypothetical protein
MMDHSKSLLPQEEKKKKNTLTCTTPASTLKELGD